MSVENGPKFAVPPQVAESEPLKGEDQHLQDIEVCIPNNPNWPSLLGYLGSEYYKRGYFKRACAAFGYLFQFDPDKPAIGQSLVRSLIMTGQREKAIDTLCTLVEKSSLTAEQRKWVREKLKELAMGEPTLPPPPQKTKVPANQPKVAEETHQMSGSVMGDLDVKSIISRHGASSEAQSATVEEQLKTVEEQLKQDPKNTMLLDWYAFVLYTNGRINESITTYERLIKEFQPNANRLYYLGSAYLASHRLNDCLTCWKYLEQWYPNSPLVKRTQKKLARVKAALPKVKTKPLDKLETKNLEFTDFTKYKKGDGAGIAEVEALLAKDPDNLSVLDWTAFINYSNGNFKRALELYQKLVEKDPGNLHAYYYVGNIYCRTGRYGEAARQWRVLLERFPDHKLAVKAKPKLEKIEAALDE